MRSVDEILGRLRAAVQLGVGPVEVRVWELRLLLDEFDDAVAKARLLERFAGGTLPATSRPRCLNFPRARAWPCRRRLGGRMDPEGWCAPCLKHRLAGALVVLVRAHPGVAIDLQGLLSIEPPAAQ